MLQHTLSWPCKHLVVIGCRKHLISSFCYKPVKLTLSPINALLRSHCQTLNDKKWKHYIIWPENTLEPSNSLKLFYKVIFIAYFVLKYDKNGICFNNKNYPTKILSILILFQLHYVGTHFVMTVWAFGGHWIQKHLISSFCYTPVKLTFSPTPSQKALLRSPCQAVTMKTSQTLSQMTREHTGTIKLKSPGGATISLNKALFGVGPLTIIHWAILVNF